MHEVLVNRLGGLSLPRKSVVRLTDRPDMTLDVYRGRKTTMQQQCNLKKMIIALHKQNDSFKVYEYTGLCDFLYTRLKNGRIMLYPLASVRLSVRPSVCKLFRFRVTPPTV